MTPNISQTSSAFADYPSKTLQTINFEKSPPKSKEESTKGSTEKSTTAKSQDQASNAERVQPESKQATKWFRPGEDHYIIQKISQ